VCALNVELMFCPSKEGSRSQTVDFKLADPMPASLQVRGDRAVFYIQVESRYLNALKMDELLRFDSFGSPRLEPSLVVLCSHIEDSVVVAEHFRRVLPQIVGFDVIPNLTGKNFQSSSVFQLKPDEAIVGNGIVFGFQRVKQRSEWNANQFLAGHD
jgi:hypothetical protein